MTGFTYRDIVHDLSHVLILFTEPMNLQFSFQNTPIFLQEVFSPSGFLPIFIYDKQDFINQHLRYKNKPQQDMPFFASFELEQADSYAESYFDSKIVVKHNLLNDFNTAGYSLYDDLIYSLAEKILSDQDLVVQDNIIALDFKYNIFHKFVKNISFVQSQHSEPIEGKL